MREGGETTFHVSASECTSECGAGPYPDQLAWADPGGDIAVFVSCGKLTNQSAPSVACSGYSTVSTEQNTKLYRWDRNAPPGVRLTDISIDKEPADGVQPKAIDVIGGSDDGNTIYFIAGGQLVAGEPTHSSLKIYRWRWNGGSPQLEYLGPYVSTPRNGSGSNVTNLETDPNADRRDVRVTPDGEHLMMTTPVRLNFAGDRDTDVDAYRWDEENGWTCLSCQTPGAPSAGHVDATMTNLEYNASQRFSSLNPRVSISDDGARVYFDTPDALVPEDVNGESGCPVYAETLYAGLTYTCQDVYEWNEGAVRLISGGSGPNPSVFLGATGDGNAVFFGTRDRLVGWDKDEGFDIYSSRIGGGFPEPPPQPPQCEGESCRGASSEAAPVPGAGTAAFEGPPDPSTGNRRTRCGEGKVRRGSRCLSAKAIARRRCRRLSGKAKRHCIRNQTRRTLRRSAHGRAAANRANFDRRAAR